MTSRLIAADALVKSLRTGEHSAAVALEPYLDEGVILERSWRATCACGSP